MVQPNSLKGKAELNVELVCQKCVTNICINYCWNVYFSSGKIGCIGSKYALYEDGIVVMIDSKWYFFRKEKSKLSLDMVIELSQREINSLGMILKSMTVQILVVDYIFYATKQIIIFIYLQVVAVQRKNLCIFGLYERVMKKIISILEQRMQKALFLCKGGSSLIVVYRKIRSHPCRTDLFLVRGSKGQFP